MGCANTKAGGAAVAEDGALEGGDAQQQKDVPKVMVDGDDMAVNGNVVNANGMEEGTTEDKEPACNGDLAENKRKSKASADEGAEEGSPKNADATTPSGDNKSNSALNGEEAKMADEDEDAGDNAQREADCGEQSEDKKEEASTDEKAGGSTDNEKEAAESRNSED